MRLVLTAVCGLGICCHVHAQPSASAIDIVAPCLDGHASVQDVTAAVEAQGWRMADAPEHRLEGLRAAAEPLIAQEQLSRANTPEDFDRHISGAHGAAEFLLPSASVLARDGLFNVIEFHDPEIGGMIRCTIVGTAFPLVDEVFASHPADVTRIHGHQFIVSPVEGAPSPSDVTWYRIAIPQGATAKPNGTMAAIGVVHARY